MLAKTEFQMTVVDTKIDIRKVEQSKISSVDFNNLPFGRTFSDHMYVVDYDNGAWGTPHIMPFESMTMHPACSALHYGQSIFEGLKAYKTESGQINIFRADQNAKRFNESAKRMCMPEFPESMFLDAIKTLLTLDQAWVPQKRGSSLYIRPFMFATDEYVGIKPSDKYRFIIFTCPVGSYYAEPLRVKIETKYTRAAEGGVGRAKTAGNYAASLYPAKLNQEKGYHQLVWTDAKTHEYIEESGTMNIMFMIDGTLITPSEETDTILRGITKRSVLELAEKWGVPVEERKVTVKEVYEAAKNGTLQEVFGAGTAATIAQIKTIGFEDGDIEMPPIENRTFSNKVLQYLDDVKYGAIEDENNWNIVID